MIVTRDVSQATGSRLRFAGLLDEAMCGILQQPLRSVLTMLGTVIGIGAFVSILGLTATASSQVDKRFTALSATQVRVEDVGDVAATTVTGTSFSRDAVQRVRRIHGVVTGGVWWTVPLVNSTIAASSRLSAPSSSGLGVAAVQPAALSAMAAGLGVGRLYDVFHEATSADVAVLGRAAADRLGIHSLGARPAVFVDGHAFTVVGILRDIKREPALLSSVIVPTTTARRIFGAPVDPRAEMIIQTRLGAAQVVAEQAALALRPDDPAAFRVSAPTDPTQLRGRVTQDFSFLFLSLAGMSLTIGTAGIINTMLVSVLERTQEIGLRRALGARRRHIVEQFLAESMVLATLGSLAGASGGVLVVVLVALARHWSATLQPWAVLPAPVFGLIIGIVAGAYPALRAARVEPVAALRR